MVILLVKFQTIPEDGMPEVLPDNFSSTSRIKTASPSSKRVLPHCNLGRQLVEAVARSRYCSLFHHFFLPLLALNIVVPLRVG